MLENLDNAPWSDLTHARGPAADVPARLRALLSADPEVRGQALRGCHDTLCPPGARTEVSARTVPFLLEMVDDPATPDRAALLHLLVALAVGHDGAWLPDGLPPAAGDRGWGRLEADAHRAVGEGVPVLLKALRDDDAAVRRAAAGALGWFPAQAPATVGELTWVALDPDPAVVATAVLALGLVGRDRPLAAEVVTAAFADPRELVRGAAAIALARLRGAAAGPAVADELRRWATGAAGEQRTEVPYNGGDLRGYAALALRQTVPGQA